MKVTIRDFWPATIHKTWMEKNSAQNIVTVIIPTFNRQKMVLDAINSVYDQTYRPIELIVVDDGSTDETKDLIENWVKKHKSDPFFNMFYEYQDNIGVSGARNLGLIKSHGEFIQYLDSDDLLLPNRLEVCIAAFKKNPDLDFVHSAFYLDYGDDSRRGYILSRPVSIGSKPNPRNYVWTAAGLFRRKLIFEAGPWNENLQICEDSEYFSRLFAITENCLAIPDALAIKRKHSESRLLDIRMNERGLKDKYQSIILRDRLLEKFGDKYGSINAKLWVVQDAFSAGEIEFGKKLLSDIEAESKRSIRSFIRWFLLKSSTLLSNKFVMVFWQKITYLRNELKWKLDMMKGKLLQAQK